MITTANESMLPRLKRIWQTCFEDDENGTDFVFSRLLNPAQMLVETDDDDRPVAMLNWKLLRFTTPRSALAGAYVYGVATLPEHQGRGISKRLMNELHPILEKEGAGLSCLIPASASLFDFYARQGFETYFSYKKIRVNATDIASAKEEGVLSKIDAEKLWELRGAVFAGCSLFGAWDAEYLRYTGQECEFYGGDVLRFSTGGKNGYAFCYPRENGLLVVKEAVADREDIATLLAALHSRYHAKTYEIRFPADFPITGLGTHTQETLPIGMVKWYDRGKSQAVGSLGGAPWFAFGLDY